jgi:DNA-binding NarL/FixJ family response regulator
VIRVLLNVASPALRAGLRSLLSSDKTIKVMTDTLNEEIEADVVITSASRMNPETDPPLSAGYLFLSDDQLNVEELKRSYRVWGILPTDASPEELTAAVHALSQGLIVGTPTLVT